MCYESIRTAIGQIRAMGRRVTGRAICAFLLPGIRSPFLRQPPATRGEGSSVLVPSAYGAGTGLPVFIFAVLITMGAQWVSKALKQLVRFEKRARRITDVIFVLVGVHYCLLYIFEVQIL